MPGLVLFYTARELCVTHLNPDQIFHFPNEMTLHHCAGESCIKKAAVRVSSSFFLSHDIDE